MHRQTERERGGRHINRVGVCVRECDTHERGRERERERESEREREKGAYS